MYENIAVGDSLKSLQSKKYIQHHTGFHHRPTVAPFSFS